MAGAVVLSMRSGFSEWYHLPPGFILFVAAANVTYGTYSFSLACSRRRPVQLVMFLAIANLIWTVVCFTSAMWFVATASPLGLVHLIGEGIYVAALGILEWRFREQLRRP